MRPVFIQFVLILSVMAALASSALCRQMVWVTDDTPGGFYITGGGDNFDPEKPGIEIELYSLVAKQLGLDITFKRLPWKRCLKLLELNQVDAVFPASFKPDRMKIGAYPMLNGQVDPSRKSRNNAYFVYKLKNNPLLWDGQNFSGLSGAVGAPLGWAVVDDLKQKNVPVIEAVADPKALKLLIHKRLQGFVCLGTVFDSYIQNDPDTYCEIVKLMPAFWEKPYYLMLSHKFAAADPQLSEKIWNAVRDIKKTETFQNILSRYLASPLD